MAIISRVELNLNGHYVIQVANLDSRAAQTELKQLKKAGSPIDEPAKACLLSKGGYVGHVLDKDQEYSVVIIPDSMIPPEVPRSVKGLCLWAHQTYDYTQTQGGIALRLREMLSISPELMEKLGLSYIAVLHRPIQETERVRRVFAVQLFERGGFLVACVDDGKAWGEGVGFAFIDFNHQWSRRS